MNERRTTADTIVLPLLLILVVSCSGLSRAAGEPDSARVSELLSTAKTQASSLNSDMQTMDFLTESDLSWQSHASIVNLYKGDIDAIRHQIAKLEDARSVASPWQKTTIDQIEPLLQSLASDAETLINRINQDPRRLNNGEFKSYIKAIADQSDELATIVRKFVDYGVTRQQLEDLSNKLDLPLAGSHP